MLLVFCIVVVVILESCSPGSVVIKKEEYDRYWTETFHYDYYFYKRQTTQDVDSESPAGRQFRITSFVVVVIPGVDPGSSLFISGIPSLW